MNFHGDACFNAANLRHGVEFVSPLYLSRLEQYEDDDDKNQPKHNNDSNNSNNNDQKQQQQQHKKVVAGALFIPGGDHQHNKRLHTGGTVFATSMTKDKLEAQNVRWAVERVVAVPADLPEPSRWLADVNRCAVRLNHSIGRSTLPGLRGATSARPLSIIPVEDEQEQQQQQQDDDDDNKKKPEFEYLILRETIPAPTASRVRDFFASLPTSEKEADDANPKRLVEVWRVSLEGVEEQTHEQQQQEQEQQQHQKQQHHHAVHEEDDDLLEYKKLYAKHQQLMHSVHLSVSCPSALRAPKNHNEPPLAMARQWLSTRFALSTAPLYSFLGGAAINVNRLELSSSPSASSSAVEQSPQHGEQAAEEDFTSTYGHLDETAVARSKNSPADDLGENALDADPFEPKNYARAEEVIAVDASGAVAAKAPPPPPPTFEQMSLHERIQRSYDAQYLGEVVVRDSARYRVMDKLAVSPEYAMCYDLLEDVDVAAANRHLHHQHHEISDNSGIFALSNVLGDSSKNQKRTAAQRLIELFGLRGGNSLFGGDSDDLMARILTDAIVGPLGSVFKLLHSTLHAQPVGHRNDAELFASGHAVIAAAAPPAQETHHQEGEEETTTTDSLFDAYPSPFFFSRETSRKFFAAISTVSRLLPRPWLADVSLRKTKAPAHFLTSEIDAYLNGQCEVTFAEAPDWSLYASWKARSVSQLPHALGGGDLFVGGGGAGAEDLASNSAAVSPSPRYRSHQRTTEAGESVAREILSGTPAHSTAHLGRPPLSPPTPRGGANNTPRTNNITMPAAAVPATAAAPGAPSPGGKTVEFVTPARSAQHHQTPAAAAASGQKHLPGVASSSAFSPMSYTSRITASTRRHFDGQFLSSPRGASLRRQQHQQQQHAKKPQHIADGRTVEFGAKYNYRWNRSWDVAEADADNEQQQQQQQQQQEQQQGGVAVSVASDEDSELNKPFPAFWDKIEMRGALSLLYGIAKRAAGPDEHEEDNHHMMRNYAVPPGSNLASPDPHMTPAAAAAGDGDTPAAGVMSPQQSTATRGRSLLLSHERDTYRTYLGESAVPPGDGSTRFYSLLNVSAAWLAEKTMTASTLLRLRGGCRWALASDPSAVPTLDEKNKEQDARLLRGSQFLNHFFTTGQTKLPEQLADEQTRFPNAAAGNSTASSTCIHQPQGALVLELEKLLPFLRMRTNVFLGGSASCHVLSGVDYLGAINADVSRGPNPFSNLFGAPTLVAPSVARAAESRARGKMSQTGTAASKFSLATNMRALAEVVAGVSLTIPMTPLCADECGELPSETKDLGRRLELSWWWPLWSLDTMASQQGKMMMMTGQQQQQFMSPLRTGGGGGASGNNQSIWSKATHRFGLSLHL